MLCASLFGVSATGPDEITKTLLTNLIFCRRPPRGRRRWQIWKPSTASWQVTLSSWWIRSISSLTLKTRWKTQWKTWLWVHHSLYIVQRLVSWYPGQLPLLSKHYLTIWSGYPWLLAGIGSLRICLLLGQRIRCETVPLSGVRGAWELAFPDTAYGPFQPKWWTNSKCLKLWIWISSIHTKHI